MLPVRLGELGVEIIGGTDTGTSRSVRERAGRSRERTGCVDDN